MSAQPVILLHADDASRRASLQRALERGGLGVVSASDVASAEGALARTAVDAVVVDASRDARDAERLLHLVQERARETPLVVLASLEGDEAAALVRDGAFAVLPPGARPELLVGGVRRAAQQHALQREVARLRLELRGPRDRVPLLGRSEAMREMSRQVDELAGRSGPVLLVGERGTGRALVARELHARSPRASAPFVALSVTGLSEVLVESQLFGHRRGAFPGAAQDHEGAFRQAAGGTLLLSGVDRLTPGLQEKLVQAIDTGRITPLGADQPVEVDVRLACSTTRDLGAMARAGTFRDDLLRRMAAGRLELPPLRERSEDVVFLAEAFAAEAAERLGIGVRRFDAESQQTLASYPWPGNVTELRDAVDHAFGRAVGETLRLEHLPATVRAGARASFALPRDRHPTLAESEAWLVAVVLEDAGGNKTEAARRLGIDRKRLYRKIRKYGLLGEGEGVDEDE